MIWRRTSSHSRLHEARWLAHDDHARRERAQLHNARRLEVTPYRAGAEAVVRAPARNALFDAIGQHRGGGCCGAPTNLRDLATLWFVAGGAVKGVRSLMARRRGSVHVRSGGLWSAGWWPGGRRCGPALHRGVLQRGALGPGWLSLNV
jgi:hypothetical protein